MVGARQGASAVARRGHLRSRPCSHSPPQYVPNTIIGTNSTYRRQPIKRHLDAQADMFGEPRKHLSPMPDIIVLRVQRQLGQERRRRPHQEQAAQRQQAFLANPVPLRVAEAQEDGVLVRCGRIRAWQEGSGLRGRGGAVGGGHFFLGGLEEIVAIDGLWCLLERKKVDGD